MLGSKLQSGTASYQNPGPPAFSDWGVFSTSVDPTDPNVFWTFNAYAAQSQ